MHNCKDKASSDDQRLKAPFGVIFIRNCILILAIMLSAGIFMELIRGFSGLSAEKLIRAGLQCAILWITFYGIKKVKSWTVILVLICSYFAFVTTILGFFQASVVNGYDLLNKFYQLCLIIFYALQIMIFSRSETKRYFKEKGIIVIS